MSLIFNNKRKPIETAKLLISPDWCCWISGHPTFSFTFVPLRELGEAEPRALSQHLQSALERFIVHHFGTADLPGL